MLRPSTITDKWPTVELGDAVDFLDNMRKPVKASERMEGQYNYYGANGLQGTIDDFIFDEPLVLLAEDGGHFGNPERDIAYIAEGKYWVNNHAHVLKPRSNLDLSFLFRALQRYDVTSFIKGATRAKLTKGDASRIPIPLPPLPEQKRIAAILDKADAIRRKRQQAIQLADQFLRAIFLEMFGDPVMNPKGWELHKFENIGTLDRGKSKHRPRNDPSLLGGDQPLIQTGDVANSGGYIKSYESTYSDLGLQQSRKWPQGTLCITIAANIAKTGILTFDACFPDSVVGFTPNEKTTVEFVQFWLGFLQKTLESSAPESAQKNINLAILRNLDIPLPDIDEQKRFSEIVRKAVLLKDKVGSSVTQKEELFSSLSQKSFAGDL